MSTNCFTLLTPSPKPQAICNFLQTQNHKTFFAKIRKQTYRLTPPQQKAIFRLRPLIQCTHVVSGRKVALTSVKLEQSLNLSTLSAYSVALTGSGQPAKIWPLPRPEPIARHRTALSLFERRCRAVLF